MRPSFAQKVKAILMTRAGRKNQGAGSKMDAQWLKKDLPG
jgi:hypothetical protein